MGVGDSCWLWSLQSLLFFHILLHQHTHVYFKVILCEKSRDFTSMNQEVLLRWLGPAKLGKFNQTLVEGKQSRRNKRCAKSSCLPWTMLRLTRSGTRIYVTRPQRSKGAKIFNNYKKKVIFLPEAGSVATVNETWARPLTPNLIKSSKVIITIINP